MTVLISLDTCVVSKRNKEEENTHESMNFKTEKIKRKPKGVRKMK